MTAKAVETLRNTAYVLNGSGPIRFGFDSDRAMAEHEAALAQVESWYDALVKITGCRRDDFANAAKVARCALGWPST